MSYSITLYGTLDADTLEGSAADERIYGGTADIAPQDGGDVIRGLNGADLIYGNGGDDVIYGDDFYIGDSTTLANHDTLYGGMGKDSLFGGGGNDVLYGLDGKDLLSGGTGYNMLIGGEDADIFVMLNPFGISVTAYNTIVDFSEGDVISIQRTASIKSYADIAANLISDENGTFLKLSDTQGVNIANIQASELGEADFYFWS